MSKLMLSVAAFAIAGLIVSAPLNAAPVAYGSDCGEGGCPSKKTCPKEGDSSANRGPKKEGAKEGDSKDSQAGAKKEAPKA